MKSRRLCIFSIVAVMLFTAVLANTYDRHYVEADSKTITQDAMLDKLKGGWMGALWGNFAGLPTEFQFIEQPNPNDSVEWVTGNLFVTDDDTSLEYTFLHMMEVYGANDITYADMPAEWIYHFQDYIWEGNYNARQLMLGGLKPPYTGKFGYNKTPEAIDAQIECEVFGMVTPGMLENCYGRTKWWMAAVGDGVVLENSAFYSMLCSNAFFERDIHKNLATVRGYFDNSLPTAKIYDRVLQLYNQYPDSWRTARQVLYSEYYANYALDCRINFAMTILALLYGNNDYEQTVQIAILAGFDNDCNAATAGTILGIEKGYSELPENLKENSADIYRNTNRPGLASNTIDELAQRLLKQAEVIIKGAGGIKNGNSYIIYDAGFVPPQEKQAEYTKKVPATNAAWSYDGMYKFYNGGYCAKEGYCTVRKGDKATFTFTGDSVALVSATSVNGGSLSIEIDGKDYGVVSLKSEATYTVNTYITLATGQVLRKVRGLGEGQHKMVLTSLEDGKWHSVDYAEVECSEEEYYSAEGLNLARTFALSPICSVQSPQGEGAGGGKINVICDGVYFKDGMHSSTQYDSFLGKRNGVAIPKDFEDYIGYDFSRKFDISKLVYNEGGHWGSDGGWFADGSLRVEIKQNGEWVSVDFDISPSYPNSNSSSVFNTSNCGKTYVITLNCKDAEGVRLIGTSGGVYKLISCGELEVYA